MMDMIEKVARALAKANTHSVDSDWTFYAEEARAAIEAMREPTDAMTAEGGDTPCGQFYPGSQAANIWRNMIDAAITQTSP